MSSKVSNLNLYSSDNLSEKALFVEGKDATLKFESPNEMELKAPSFKLSGQTTSAHDISDLGLYLKTLSDLQSSDSTTQTAAIASNTTALANLTATESANHSAQATLLGVESANRASEDAVLQTNIDAENVRALAAELVNANAITAESNARSTADTSLQANIDVEKGRIDAILAGSSVSLDSFLEVVNAYQGSDASILTQIGTINTQISQIQATLNTLTA